jgi:hypothetical protein
MLPLLMRGTDGIWRMGPRFPLNARKTAAQTAASTARTALLQKITGDIESGKYATGRDVVAAFGRQ